MNKPDPVIRPELLARYLQLLGVKRRQPGIDALHELVRAQVITVPFENISKLHYKKYNKLHALPGLEMFLDGMEHFHFGGTCYSANYYFYQLLANLGYQVKLCGADMADPDVHLVSIVTLEQREYLVDVGYAAPFLTPLPRDLTTDHTLVLGRDRYVLKPRDARGRSRMELFRDGSLKHCYSVNPASRQIQEFDQVVADSYREDSTFMNTLLLARFFPGRSLVIHNLSVIESEGTGSKIQVLNGLDELAQTANKYFAIPLKIINDVVKEVGLDGDAWN